LPLSSGSPLKSTDIIEERVAFIFRDEDGECPSKISVNFRLTTWHYIPENLTLYDHYYEDLKSYILKMKTMLKLMLLSFSLTISHP
jgi:hypothetical protein